MELTAVASRFKSAFAEITDPVRIALQVLGKNAIPSTDSSTQTNEVRIVGAREYAATLRCLAAVRSQAENAQEMLSGQTSNEADFINNLSPFEKTITESAEKRMQEDDIATYNQNEDDAQSEECEIARAPSPAPSPASTAQVLMSMDSTYGERETRQRVKLMRELAEADGYPDLIAPQLRDRYHAFTTDDLYGKLENQRRESRRKRPRERFPTKEEVLGVWAPREPLSVHEVQMLSRDNKFCYIATVVKHFREAKATLGDTAAPITQERFASMYGLTLAQLYDHNSGRTKNKYVDDLFFND
jgi:hypothetical protein